MSKIGGRENPGEPRPAQKWLKTEVLPVAPWTVQRWQDDQFEEFEDGVVMEEPFEVRLNGRSLAVIMRTPGSNLESDRELALGFLLSEGVITDPQAVASIRRVKDADGLPEENVLDVTLSSNLEPPADETEAQPAAVFERRFVVGSSCGLCGKNSIVEACRRLPPLERDAFRVTPQVIYSLPESLRAAQAVFDRTGGLHAAGLFDSHGQLILLREDIGRHNAVDRLLGRMALDGAFPMPGHILQVSGRLSYDLILKALVARIPVISAVSAPSSLALQLADEANLTVIGFVRGHRMNVYTHHWRVMRDEG